MVVMCPNCRGMGFVISVFTSKADTSCSWCDGKRKVDTEQTCKCGRPAVRMTGMVLTCTHKRCIDQVLGVQHKDQSSFRPGRTLNPMSKDDQEAYDQWMHDRMY